MDDITKNPPSDPPIVVKKPKKRKMNWGDMTALQVLAAVGETERAEVIKNWALDPENREVLRMVVRAAIAFQKMYLGMMNRDRSPVPDANDIAMLRGDVKILKALASTMDETSSAIQKSVGFLVQQSDIGQWLMSQKGLGAGWLAGYLLSEFPDIYDPAICLRCGTFLRRRLDGSYVHPTLPGSTVCAPPVRVDGAEEEDDEEEALEAKERIVVAEVAYSGDRMVKINAVDCPLQGKAVEPQDYRIHETKPSSFLKFAGLHTVQGYACPVCKYNLTWSDGDSKRKDSRGWKHPNYVAKLPDGYEPCIHRGKVFLQDHPTHLPVLDREIEAISRMVSPKREKGKKLEYHSKLRAKILGPKGVAFQLVNAKHPKYASLFYDYLGGLRQRDPWRQDAHMKKMAYRRVAQQFVIDFYMKYRLTEGLVVRPSYAEEKLGIVHHE